MNKPHYILIPLAIGILSVFTAFFLLLCWKDAYHHNQNLMIALVVSGTILILAALYLMTWMHQLDMKYVREQAISEKPNGEAAKSYEISPEILEEMRRNAHQRAVDLLSLIHI
jgi:flagellar basal body-associated protein FliL